MRNLLTAVFKLWTHNPRQETFMKPTISMDEPQRSIPLNQVIYGACAVTATVLVVFLPTLYFPYLSNDGYAELYAFNPEGYFRQAVSEGRVLRYFLLRTY